MRLLSAFYNAVFQGFAIGILIFASASTASAENDMTFDITLQHQRDAVEVMQDNARVCFVIRSATGIGKVTIARDAAQWPEKVCLRLHIKGLESLKLTAGERRQQLAVSSHNKQVRQWIDDGEEHPLDQHHPQWLAVRYLDLPGQVTEALPVPEGYFEIVLPTSILKANPPAMAIEWIDFYRH